MFARLRPVTPPEAHLRKLRVHRRYGQQRTIHAKNLEFVLDWVWDDGDGQAEVYERGVGERISWVMQGYNVTILAYGQTGSGKVSCSPVRDSALVAREHVHRWYGARCAHPRRKRPWRVRTLLACARSRVRTLLWSMLISPPRDCVRLAFACSLCGARAL